MAAEVFLSGFRVSIFTLLIVAAHGFPQKSSQSTGQSSSGGNAAAANYASYQGAAPSFAAAPYGAVQDAYGTTSVQGPMYQPVVVSSSGPAAPVAAQGAGVFPVAEAGMQGAGASMAQVGGPAAGVGQGSGFITSQLMTPVITAPQIYVPVAGPSDGTQDGQSATQWLIPVPDAGSAATPDIGAVLPPPPLPEAPTPKSGELSRVEKEAELGNYQQQTEDFGYPLSTAGSGQQFGQGLSTVFVPGVQLGGAGLGGYHPVSPRGIDWVFLLGGYPPGLITTFSQHHEAGKDYSQAIHYLKEHVTDDGGSGQQQKFF